jgi:hypothetical protein
MDMCASSSFIYSALFAWIAGVARRQVTCLLLRQKKVTKEKATLFVVPTLRYGHAAVLVKSGVTCKLASLRQHAP